MATKIVSQEVIYPDQLLVVDKSRTTFVFYEMNTNASDKHTTASYKRNTASYKRTTALYNDSYVR